MKQRRKERGEEVKTVRFQGDEEEYGEEVDGDSEELVYDSEEEAERDQEAFLEKFEASKIKSQEQQIDTQSINFYEINKEMLNVRKFKPALGVKYVEYDEFGLPNNAEGDELRKWISTDNAPSDIVIEAPPDVLERAMHPTGERHDLDKQVEDMNEEGK